MWVEGLDFSQCKTTAGDLNQGDLAQIMGAEKTLHGVVHPIIEIAGAKKTLVFTASVFAAERMAEIANRHQQGCAEFICGETPIEDRRNLLKRYALGGFQFLFNCDVASEGFDEPSIEMVAIAKPTKSRAKYAQMIGRGTRPVVPSALPTPEQRCEQIADSHKGSLLVLDFVGNSGRHKLIHATDILGVEYDDDELRDALQEIMERSQAGQATDVEQSFQIAEERRQAARKQREIDSAARSRREQEELLRYEDEQRRKAIVGIAKYGTKVVDAFDRLDINAGREPGWHKGRKPSLAQVNLIRKHYKFDESALEKLSWFHAKKLCDEFFRRMNYKLCTVRQAMKLKEYGYEPEVSFDEAKKILDGLAQNGWRRKDAG